MRPYCVFLVKLLVRTYISALQVRFCPDFLTSAFKIYIMKRSTLLIALFLLLGVGAWFALRQKNAQDSTIKSWDMEFAVPNTGDIYKIFIADRNNTSATLERKDGYWLYNGKYEARPTAVQTLLQTIKSVRVQYVPTKSAEEGLVRSLATDGIKVELYDKSGDKIKVYYVGGVTADERGTYMIMDKSENPYVTHIPSFVGQLRVRYLLGDDNWRTRHVFNEKPEEIQSISVDYPQRKSAAFVLDKVSEAEYQVKPFYSTTRTIPTPQRKGVAEGYLLQFEAMIAEAHENGFELRDSVKTLVPFAIVTLKKTNGMEKKVTFWPQQYDQESGNKMSQALRYFTLYENKGANQESFMLTQQRVFGTVFRTYEYFFEGQPTGKLPN